MAQLQINAISICKIYPFKSTPLDAYKDELFVIEEIDIFMHFICLGYRMLLGKYWGVWGSIYGYPREPEVANARE